MDGNTELSRRAFLAGATGATIGSSATAGTGVAAAQQGTTTGGDQETGTAGGGTGTSGGGTGTSGGGGGTPPPSNPPSVPKSAKAIGVAVTIGMIATVGLSLFFLKYGGNYDVEE